MKKVLIAALAAVSCATCAAALAFTGGSLPATAADWQSVALEDAYAYGTRLMVPSRTVTVNGTTVQAVPTLRLPDGSASSATQTALDMTGVWTLSYTAIIDGKGYRQDETFEVYDEIVRVGQGSSAVWQEYVYPVTGEPTGRTGLQVSLAQGDTLEFSPIIDLSEATASQPFIELFATPSQIGAVDFEKITVTLTDVEDANCYVRISGRQSAEGNVSSFTYFLAGGNGQPMEGWEGNGWDKLHINNEWGTPFRHSFYGTYPDNPDEIPGESLISLRYDAATRSVYTGTNFVIDLDSTQYFSTLWSGFPSGRVRISVSADLYSGSAANFMVTSLMGVDLSQNRLTDASAPQISIAAETSSMPAAEVGRQYPVPAATAWDDYSDDCPVTAEVWYNFTSANAVSVPLEEGSFTPERRGLYAIVYRAEDAADNMAEQIVWVNALTDAPDVTIGLDSTELTAMAGETVALPAAHTDGGSGPVTVSVAVVSDDGETPVSGTFRPVKAGTYTLIYTATDYIGQTALAQCTVTVSPNATPVFPDEITLPRYLFSGSAYSVPEVYADDYSGAEPVQRPASVYLRDAMGERQVTGTFTPTVLQNGDTVDLIFRIDGTDAERVCTIRTLLPFAAQDGRMRLQMQNYFVTDGATAQAGDSAVTIGAQRADGGFTFANRLLAEGFSLSLNAVPAKSLYVGLKITLEDSLDPSVRLVIEIAKNGTTSLARVGTASVELSSGFLTSSASNAFVIGYRSGTVTFGTVSLSAGTFAGFPSGFAYLSVAFAGASEGSAFEVMDINDQPISAAANDRIRPKINLFGTYGDAAAFGARQVIPAAIAGDVLDPNTTLLLTVTAPDGTNVTAADGTVLSGIVPERAYEIDLTQYGQYFVSYVASDTFSGKSFELGYAITVEDRTAPEITFAHDFAASVKVGDVIVIPDFTVTDNVTAADGLRIAKYVLTSQGRLIELTGTGNAFRPVHAGEYEVRIIAVDAAGNIAMVRQIVTVTE